MRVPILLILVLLVIYAVDGSVIPDRALTASLQDAWYDDEFIIAISNFKDKKKSSSGSVETLLAVKYRGVKTKLVLLLDRRTKRVILESLDEAGQRSASHVKVDSLTVNTPLKSLIMLVHQAQPNPRVDVYVDCTYEGSIPFKTTFRDIAEIEDNLDVEVFRERKCRTKVYQSATITDVLRKEQCPDNLPKMKQPSVFDTDTPKTQPTDSDEDYQNKPTDQPDESSDEINGPNLPGQNNNGLSPSSNSKFPWDHKKPSDKKHHGGHPNDSNRPKKKDSSGYPKDKNKPNKYDPYDSSDPFSQSGQTDDLDYPYGPHPPQSPASRPKKHPKSGKPNQSGSKPDKSDPYGFDKQLDGSSPYDFNKNPAPTSDESLGSSVGSNPFNNPKRPGRSPYHGSSGQNGYPYPNQTDMPDSDELSGKRVPRRGDIGIQSLDEKVCQTDDQIVKTLNELINATRKLGRELELSRMETQHLRHLIENCSACRTPIEVSQNRIVMPVE